MINLPALQMHGEFLQQLPVLSPAVLNLSVPRVLNEQPIGIVEDPSFSLAVMLMPNSLAASEHSE